MKLKNIYSTRIQPVIVLLLLLVTVIVIVTTNPLSTLLKTTFKNNIMIIIPLRSTPFTYLKRNIQYKNNDTVLLSPLSILSALSSKTKSKPTKSTKTKLLYSQYNDTHQPYYFTEQLIDHTIQKSSISNNYYTQRYYQSDEYYNYDYTSKDSMSPIFVIIGGEGSIEPSTGLLYPFVYTTLAKRFSAYVLQPEHRFYGISQPINRSIIDYAISNNLPDPRINILTYEQALNDIVRLLYNVTIDILGCTIPDNNEYNKNKYRNLPNCGPIIAVGGSYSGFLSAMTRIIHPTIFDISYAASAPIYYYSQQVQFNKYYEHISTVIDQYFPSCTKSVYNTINFMQHYYYTTYPNNKSIDTTGISLIGICCASTSSTSTSTTDDKNHTVNCTVPLYAITNAQIFINEVNMMIAYTFANANMAFYPPSSTDDTMLKRACTIFLDKSTAPFEKLSQFFISFLGNSKNNNNNRNNNNKQQQQNQNQNQQCFNMIQQVPYGPKGTISSGDWTGVGTGYDGDSWDYQTCTQLIETISVSGSLFPTSRIWTYEWLQNHCSQRFTTVIPNRTYNNDMYQLNKLFNATSSSTIDNNTNNLSYTLFTNGFNDGWSVSGVTHNISETIVSLNFPNGAHHSDLNRVGVNPTTDTNDITNGYKQIEFILSQWITAINVEKKKQKIKQKEGRIAK